MTRRTFLTFATIIVVVVTLTVIALAARVHPVSPSPKTVVVTTMIRNIPPPRMALPVPSSTTEHRTH